VTERQNKRRRARSGRDPSAAPVAGPAYLTRMIPPYEFMEEEGLVRIEETADDILSEIGIRFYEDEEALRLWKEAGATVDGDRVRFDRGMVRAIVQKSAPEEFTQLSRNPARSVQIGGRNTVFAPSYGSPFVRGMDERRRYATIEDFRNFVKLTYSSPWLHHSGGTICEPVEIPVNKRHLDMVHAHLTLSDKPLLGSVTAPERAQDSIDMCRIVFGDDVVDKNCVIMGNINANSPLTFDGVMSGALRTYSAAGQGMIIVPFILGGAMGPVTNAGAIAQALAEAMVGIALTQLVRPGAPAIFGTFLSSMSLRSGAPTFGMPEPAIGNYVIGQLARRLKVPFRSGGSLTSSKVPDAQAAQESSDSLMPALMSGTHYMLHAAGWLEGGLTMGYEKFMIDQDHLGMMHVFAKGMETDENALAMDAFRECGPGQHFLGCAHTMANYQTAFFDSEISDSNSYEQWRDGGRKDAMQRANERWKASLQSYEPPAMDEGMAEALSEFVAKKKESMADAWY